MFKQQNIFEGCKEASDLTVSIVKKLIQAK